MKYKIVQTIQKGFSLLETIIYMGMMSILLTALSVIFTTILDVQLESDALSGLENDGRYIFERMAYDIQRADAITSPAQGASGNSLSLTIDGVSHTYSLSGDRLQVQQGASTILLNAYDTTTPAVTFTRLGDTGNKQSIRVTLTLNSITQSNSGIQTKTITTTIGER